MNRLSESTSPYLRQHANNPVDWYPWGSEAFDEARRSNRPVLLSIGYASCHWCHVMARESFEDPETARMMNDAFVNVKIDREERPDIDSIYMEATQAMTGNGGWPMTVLTDSQGRPFFAGTYFPKDPHGDLPSFMDLISGVVDAWQNRRDDVDLQAGQLHQAIEARTHVTRASSDNNSDLVEITRDALLGAYDNEWGGFGHMPKFPHSSAIDFLLQCGDDDSVAAATNSLDAMASGGIYDHLGGGFARYSTDAFWMVPHFEKMLYDQAGLLRSYTRAYLATGAPRFAQVAAETADYVLGELALDAGTFASSEDADSEGEEGRFYVWRIEEVESVIGPEATQQFVDWYGMTRQGNFEGSNILHRPKRGDLERSPTLEASRFALLNARAGRTRPSLDDKALTEWNAMFIASLSEAASAFDRPAWLQICETTAAELLRSHRDETGRWLRSPHGAPGFAGDYAWLLDAFTRVGEATGNRRWLDDAVGVADQMIELFWDGDNGGLFTVGSDAEQLIVRNKELFDGASASANSTAAVGLARLGVLVGRDDYIEHSGQIVTLVADQMHHHATAFANMAIAVDLLHNATTRTVIVGDQPEMVSAIATRFLPRNVMLWGNALSDDKTDTLPENEPNDGAYVCTGRTCGPVVTNVEDLLAQLNR